MADTVIVTVVKWHTAGGMVQPVGHTYQVPADQVESLVAQGLVTVNGTAAPAATPPPAPKAAKPRRQYSTTEVVAKRKTRLTAKRKK